MLYVFYGTDTFRSREAYVAARTKAANTVGTPCRVLRDEERTVASVTEALEAQSLFGDPRPLAVERLTAFTGDDAERVTEALRHAPGERTVLVWEDGTPPANGIVWRALRAAATACTAFDQLGESDARTWIVQRAQVAGCLVKPAAVQRLLTACDGNLWCVAAELDKLMLLRSRGAVTVADVDEIVSGGHPAADLFATVRALVSGDGRAALKFLVAYERSGEDPRRLFFLVVRDVQRLLQVRMTLDRGEPLNAWDLARDFRLPHAAAAHLLAVAGKTTALALRTLFDRCVVAYYHLNTGRAEAAEVLERLALGTLVGA
jgi:DNA polymerase III delta subunit